MKFIRPSLRLSFLLAFSPTLLAQESGNEANKKLRTTIQKWVAVMQETQSKQKEWKEQKQILTDSRASLEAENVQMESEILSAFSRLSKTDAASKEKLDQKNRYDEGREELREGLNGLEERISAVIPLLPAELAGQPKLEKAIVDHRNFVIRKDKEAIGLNSRLTAMLTILTEAEKFNQVVTPFSGKTSEAGGQKILLDGIYFGLATGFAANEDGTIAFRLVPGPEGWVDEEITDPDVIEEVRELIDVGNGAGETRLVSIPLEIGE